MLECASESHLYKLYVENIYGGGEGVVQKFIKIRVGVGVSRQRDF